MRLVKIITNDMYMVFLLPKQQSTTQQILIAFPLTNKLVIGFQGKRRLNRF